LPTASPPPTLYTLPALAQILNVSTRTLRRLAARGELPTVRVTADVVRVLDRDVETFLQRRRTAAETESRP
jgi:excisionase family DNA binding protein